MNKGDKRQQDKLWNAAYNEYRNRYHNRNPFDDVFLNGSKPIIRNCEKTAYDDVMTVMTPAVSIAKQMNSYDDIFE